jgi:hypothetical protein
MKSKTTNVVIAGLGGQGVIKASDILADAAFSTGIDVKKSEIHGMSQRGGSVASDVRFGERVFSPMVTEGEADFLRSDRSKPAHARRKGASDRTRANRRIEALQQKKYQRGAAGRAQPSSFLLRRNLDRSAEAQSAHSRD